MLKIKEAFSKRRGWSGCTCTHTFLVKSLLPLKSFIVTCYWISNLNIKLMKFIINVVALAFISRYLYPFCITCHMMAQSGWQDIPKLFSFPFAASIGDQYQSSIVTHWEWQFVRFRGSLMNTLKVLKFCHITYW